MRLKVVIGWFAGVLGSGLLGGCESPALPPAFVVDVPWAMAERTLRVDLHTHSRFSDGAQTVSELAALARTHGCHGIAVTDHAVPGSNAAGDNYFAALTAAREESEFPKIIGGLEWQPPDHAGREHIVVLAAAKTETLLREFRRQFELQPAAAGWRWLGSNRHQPHDFVAFYAHPSREDTSATENRDDFIAWTADADVLTGFEGGPGHQRATPRARYAGAMQPIDGWDPLIGEVGGTWDQLLDQGHAVWAALANSDYHESEHDYAPCEYARTHVLVPEISADGILMGLRAGAYWAQMGPFLETLRLRVSSPGLIVPAVPGESFRTASAAALTVEVDLERDARNTVQTLTLELIGNVRDGRPGVVATATLAPGTDHAQWSLAPAVAGADGVSAYLRLRVRGLDADGRTIAAYTNPIRIYVPIE